MKDAFFNGYTLTCKRSRFKTGAVMRLLALTYWAKDRDRETVRRSMNHSTPFGAFAPDGTLVGFLRITSDHSTVFYMADVVVAQEARGKGIGLALVQYALANPKVCRGKGLLLTQTASGLYQKVGFYHVNDRLMLRDPVKPNGQAGERPAEGCCSDAAVSDAGEAVPPPADGAQRD